MKRLSISEWIHTVIKAYHDKYCDGEGVYIDATAGGGYDSEFLCRLAGDKGKVAAFDIQTAAVEKTRQRLKKGGYTARVICDSHENILEYVHPMTADVIMFNLGYFPGGDHAVQTKAETTKKAVESGLEALKSGGIMSICIYSGGDSGFDEITELIPYLTALDSKKYIVIIDKFANMPNNPPLPVFIIKK